MDQELKRNIILDHKEHPTNFKEAPNYQKITTNNINCIDKFDLYIDSDNVIKDITFYGEGCVISTATTSIMIKLLLNKTKEEALYIINQYLNMVNEEYYDYKVLEEALAFDEIYKQANRKKCATLTWEGIKEYLENN